eukprot:TRINITY_DN1139_c0_g1_i1.p1 TRINITY_DN1139_c0_g1~~TRINITY_DN1139_c0_g1_i1.p1  ORF type:complete len:257 (+),score=71.32 TRINITY_DN1139_c0_g1_i1:90-860(+)
MDPLFLILGGVGIFVLATILVLCLARKKKDNDEDLSQNDEVVSHDTSPIHGINELLSYMQSTVPTGKKKDATAESAKLQQMFEDACSLTEQKKYDEVRALLSKALTMRPFDACRLLCLRGFCYSQQERTADAIQDFSDAILKDSTNPEPFLQRALAFRKQNQLLYCQVDLARAKAMAQDAKEAEKIALLIEEVSKEKERLRLTGSTIPSADPSDVKEDIATSSSSSSSGVTSADFAEIQATNANTSAANAEKKKVE